MDRIFYSEINKKSISYRKLIDDINLIKSYKLICRYDDYCLIFRDIIISLLNNSHIIIVDSDLSEIEIKNLRLKELDFNKKISCNFNNIIDANHLVDKIRSADKWNLTLYTSGTTGVPKKVTHTLLSLTKAVKTGQNFNSDIWGFAYNPTHIAGIQVFFQAILNLNHIVRIFQLSNNEIYNSIKHFQITNISATPTFYRLLLNKNENFPSVKRLTSGGEVFDENLTTPLQKMFPNSKILNIYASTEIGTLFAAQGDVFTIKEDLINEIKIVEDELFVSTKLIGKIDDNDIIEDWYKTNDKVEIISKEPLRIKFIGRVNDSINVGGYKVFPSEVEKVINNIPGVRNCVVYGKKNSVLGKLIYCDIEKENELLKEEDIIKILKTKLQPYKIPRIINFVNDIKTTRTGKVTRI